MKRIVFLSFSFLLFTFSFAQNLVIDPSFENTVNGCAGFPFPVEGFGDLIDWDNANSNTAGDSCSSPDLFSTCNTGLIAILGVPNNNFGYQNPRTGDKYAGIITYDLTSGTYREYVQGHTTTPLVAGQTYCVSMYVSCASTTPYATNNMGIYFSNTHYLRDACVSALINVTPQLNYGCAAITDTADSWFRIQWDYTATGGEQYFVIGNFFNNAGTIIQNTGNGGFPPNPFAYYFIEDVSITPNTCCYADIVPVGPLCVTGAPLTLTAHAPNSGTNCAPVPISGTWSGPGITNAATGQFSPSVAGAGIHTISFTLSCGYVATTQIIIGPCSPLAVCQNGGNLVVSGGIGPYTWQQQTTQQDCSACLPGFPPIIQPCTTPAGCAVNVTVWTTFATGTSIPAPSTFPIRVIDTAGTILLINNLASIPTCVGCPTITVSSSNVTNVSCFGGTNGSATASATGSTTAYTYTWQPGNLSGATQNNLAAGTYTVTATDGNSCTGTTTITITQPTAAVTLQTSSTPADCGQSNGSATVVATGGTGAYTYTWSPSGGNGSVAQNIPAGSYTVSVHDVNNCTATATVSVQNTNGPVVTLVSQQNVSCNGGNNGNAVISIAQGTQPYDIVWSPSGGTATTASNLEAGAYTATITDDGGCIATQNVTITEPTAIDLTLSSQPANCGFADGSATVAASGGTGTYTYSWSPSGGSSATANALGGGAYTVTVTDASNCTNSGSVTVSVTVVDSTLSIITETTDETCAGNDGTASVTASDGNPPYTYLWSDGNDIDSSFTGGLTAGTYTITVSDECYSITQEVTVEKDFVVPPKAIPNVFTPNGDGTNDVYSVNNQFESVTNFACVIYNRWGVAVYKSTDKTITWKPKNITDGTYFIVVNYTDCTGKDDKITGTITVTGSKF